MGKSGNTLPESQRKTGLRKYTLFNRFNSLSINCLAEGSLMLYALKMGMADTKVAILSSFMPLGMVFTFFGKKLVAKDGAAPLLRKCWIVSNSFAVLMCSIPFAQKYIGDTISVWALLIFSFLFFASRGLATAVFAPILGEVTTEKNRGRITSGLFFNHFAMTIISMVIIAILLSISDDIKMFQIILFMGSLLGFASIHFMRNMPESERPKRSAASPIKESIRKLWEDKRWRKMAIANSSAFALITLIIPFSILTLKKGYGIEDDTAIFYTIVAYMGGVISSYFNGFLSDQSGPRPLLIIYIGGMCLVSAMWIFAPQNFNPFYVLGIFFLSGYFNGGILNCLSHCFLFTTPSDERISAGVLVNIMNGIAAGLAGSGLGAGSIKILSMYGHTGLGLYQAYFTIALFALLFALICAIRMEPVKDWSVKNVLSAVASLKDLKALYFLQRFDDSDSVKNDHLNVDQLGGARSKLSEDALIKYLDSPNMNLRFKALSHLSQLKLSERAEDALIEEVDEGEYTTAYYAAEIIGEHNIQKAIDVLRKKLASKDIFLKSKCMISLAQLGDEYSFQRIVEIFKKSNNPRIIISGAYAIELMGNVKHIPLLLGKTFIDNCPDNAMEELLYSTASLGECSDLFYKVMKKYNDDKEEAVELVLESIDEMCKEPRAGLQEFKAEFEKFVDGQPDSNILTQALIRFLSTFDNSRSELIKNFLEKYREKFSSLRVISCIAIIAAFQCKLNSHIT